MAVWEPPYERRQKWVWRAGWALLFFVCGTGFGVVWHFLQKAAEVCE